LADTLSAARPRPHNETVETYIKGLNNLNICNSFYGVKKSYALRYGREMCVMVIPDKISDLKTFKLACVLKEKIESDLNYPGE